MALNIGSVNFTVDAQTAGLKKAIAELTKFQKATDHVAKSQAQGAASVAAQMARQESAIKRAYQQTLNLQRSQREAGAGVGQIGTMTKAFQRLTAEMTSGTLNTIEYTRSLDAFNTRLGRSRRELNNFKASLKGNTKNNHLTEILRDLESSSVLAVGPLSGLGSRIRALGAISGRSGLLIAGMSAAIVGAGAAALVLGRNALNAGRIFEQANARFLAATGSVSQAESEMQFVIETSRRLGLRIEDTAAAYSRLTASSMGTKLAGEETRKIFLGVATAAAALRQGNLEVEGSFRAIEQMISKGNVQAEELRGQLGERLPGAFRLAAQAMGVTTQELNRMLKEGKVVAEDFLPKFAKVLTETFGSSAATNVNSYQGSLNNLNNAWLMLGKTTDAVFNVTQGVAAVYRFLTRVIDWASGKLPELADGWQVLTGWMAVAAGLAAKNAKLIKWGYEQVQEVTNGTSSAQKRLAAAVRDTNEAAKEGAEWPEMFKKQAGDIEDAIANLRVYKQALQMKGMAGKSPDTILDAVKAMEAVRGLKGKDLQNTAKMLGDALGTHIAPNAEAVAHAMAYVAGQSRKAEEEWKAFAATLDDTKLPELVSELNHEIELTNQRTKAMTSDGGAKALDFFDNVTAKVDAWAQKLKEANGGKLSGQMEQDLRKLTQALTGQFEAQREASKGTARLNQEFEMMEKRLQALRGGKESVEVFDNITQDVIRFEEALRQQGYTADEAAAAMGRYQQLLEDIHAQTKQNDINEVIKDTAIAIGELNMEFSAMTGNSINMDFFDQVTRQVYEFQKSLMDQDVPLNRVIELGRQYEEVLTRIWQRQRDIEFAQGMADAVVSELDDIMFSAKSAEDAIKDLIKALIQMTIRRAILEPLAAGLGQALTGMVSGFGRASPMTSGGHSAPVLAPGQVMAAHGATFKVGGFGGTDSQRVSFMGTPGERVEVTPLHRAGGSGGGPQVQIIDQRGAGAPPVEVSQGNSGGLDMIKVLIRGEIGNAFATGAIDRLFATNTMPMRRQGAR